ncbi:hypothetical protein FRC08_013265 [Ceratobasidium sp. 394]|nr:hypothetical protein FRC08_013265 [Ceratobasidium sp. 394]
MSEHTLNSTVFPEVSLTPLIVTGAALAAGAGEAREEGPLFDFVEFNQLNFLDISCVFYNKAVVEALSW